MPVPLFYGVPQSSEDGTTVHDVVWIKNPFMPPQEVVSDIIDDEMDFDRSSGADKKAKAALRIPGLAERSVHLSL